MKLLVSIHDVTPAHAERVAQLWALCAARGVVPALLVVPDWHGAWPLERHPAFVAWVRDRAADGADIVLHGERHDEIGLPRTWRDHIRAWGRTAGEGEFLTLDFTQAERRIRRGLERFGALQLDPVGFIPPAWLAREEGFAAAAAVGLRISEDEGSVRLLQVGRRVPSPVVRWSARTPLRAYGSIAVARARRVLQRSCDPVRIAFHPLDLAHPTTARSLGDTLDGWLVDRQPAHYRELVA